MASCKLRSISLSTSLEPPRSRMVQAVGSLHSSRKLKYSSPYLRTSNRPQAVPMSSSVISSGRLTMVAPVTRAIRLLSLLRTRRSAVTPALTKKCWAKSETPFSVMTISGLNRRMSVHMRSIASSSWRRIFSQSSSLVISKEEDWEKILRQEEEAIERMCTDILRFNPDIVITEKGVSDLAQHFFVKAGVTALRRVRKSDNNRIARVTGATIVNRPDEITEEDIGTACGLFEVRKYGDEYFSFLEECKDPTACTILL